MGSANFATGSAAGCSWSSDHKLLIVALMVPLADGHCHAAADPLLLMLLLFMLGFAKAR
jgi:hypothetical protein